MAMDKGKMFWVDGRGFKEEDEDEDSLLNGETCADEHLVRFFTASPRAHGAGVVWWEFLRGCFGGGISRDYHGAAGFAWGHFGAGEF